MTYKNPESVLVVVADASLQVLCLQRADHPDFWQSVTGSLSLGETPYQAAVRELFEETGLTLENGALVDCHQAEYFDIYPHWQHRYAPGVTRNKEHVFCFRVSAAEDINVKLSQEHIQYCWLPRDEAMQRMSSTTNQAAIKTWIK